MKCIIVDDEPLAREDLKTQISEVSAIEVVADFSNAPAALEFLKNHAVDLIFLDIQMPKVTGLEFAEQVPEGTLLVFTTAYSQYALKSYELDAIDYLLKPIQTERLKKAIDKSIVYKNLLSVETAKNSFESSNADFLIIKAEKRYHRIMYSSIRFIEGLKDYVVIYTDKQKLITSMNLKTIHQKVIAEKFIRVSKSYVVNIDFIDSLDNHTIYIGEIEIPIGEVYKEDLLSRYFGDSFSKGL